MSKNGVVYTPGDYENLIESSKPVEFRLPLKETDRGFQQRQAEAAARQQDQERADLAEAAQKNDAWWAENGDMVKIVGGFVGLALLLLGLSVADKVTEYFSKSDK